MTPRICDATGKGVFGMLLLLMGVGAWGEPAASRPSPGEGETFVVALVKCKASRPGEFTAAAIFSAPKDELLIRKGEVSVDGETFCVYWPKAKKYVLENKGKSNSHHENKSTKISIDANRDGKLTREENWFANLPIRLGDRMFEIVSIKEDKSAMELRRSDGPLRGAIVGRKCPPFSFETEDGKKVSLDGYRGRAFLLDIWSVT